MSIYYVSSMWDAQAHQPQSTHTSKHGNSLQENVITHIVTGTIMEIHGGWLRGKGYVQLSLEEGLPRKALPKKLFLGKFLPRGQVWKGIAGKQSSPSKGTAAYLCLCPRAPSCQWRLLAMWG